MMSFPREYVEGRPRAHTTGSIRHILCQQWACIADKPPLTPSVGRHRLNRETHRSKRLLSEDKPAINHRQRMRSECEAKNAPLEKTYSVDLYGPSVGPPGQSRPAIWVTPDIARSQRCRSLPDMTVSMVQSPRHPCLARLASLNARYPPTDRCISFDRCRHASGGSTTSYNEDYGFHNDGCVSVATYNVSSASSMECPVLRLTVCGATADLRKAFVEQALLLGLDEEDDDVFIDEADTRSRSTYMFLNGQEHHVTLELADDDELTPSDLTSAYVILVDSTDKGPPAVDHDLLGRLTRALPEQNGVHDLSQSGDVKVDGSVTNGVPGAEYHHVTGGTRDVTSDARVCFLVGVNSVRRGEQIVRHSADLKEVASRYGCIYLELRTQVLARTLELLENIVSQIPARSSDVMCERRSTLVAKEEIDKTSLFKKFFWTTSNCRSFENLLAL